MTETQAEEHYYLHLIQLVNLAIDKISQVLLVITSKRQTVAEKAIMSELCSCTYWNGQLVAILSQMLKDKKYILNSADGKTLWQLNNQLIDKLKDFNKAADHNWNYLEQYFEHDL